MFIGFIIGLAIIAFLCLMACLMYVDAMERFMAVALIVIVGGGMLIFVCITVAISDRGLGKEVEKPVISGRMTGSLERDYGSTLVRFTDSSGYHVRIVESIPLIENGKSSCGLAFEIENSNAKLKKAESSIEIRRGDEVVASGEWSVSISCDEIELGKTNFEVWASNTEGTRKRILKVEKYSVKEGCEKFDPMNASNACKVLAAHIAALQKPQEEIKPAQNGGSSNSSGSASKCLNYQSGKCWDDVEDAGYDDGYDDGWMGMRYGASFFDSLPAGFRNCTGVCEDIYEDAYREGYEDGKLDAGE